MFIRYRDRAVPSLLCASVLLMMMAGPAYPAPVVSKLRVEGDGQTLDPGTSYANDTIRARTTDACGEPSTDKDSYELEGANASGLIGNAARVRDALRPFRVSDTFEFALIVCQIGEFVGFGNSAWLYKVNHEEAQVAGEAFELERGDDVLWFFATFPNGPNTGLELGLSAPARAEPGQPFEVTAYQYTGTGERSPAQGVTVQGAALPTGADGKTTVVPAGEGTVTVRGTRGSDIPTPRRKVCVSADLDQCPARRGELIIGTNGDDRLDGTKGADEIRARGGDDRVDVRGGGADEVDCGSGRDRVRFGGSDEVAGDCEVLNP